MIFKFECPHCGQRISSTIDMAGTHGVCPACEQAFTIPHPPEGLIMNEPVDSLTSPIWSRVRAISTWFSQRPRQSNRLRTLLTICVCGTMIVLILIATAGLASSVVHFTYAQSSRSPALSMADAAQQAENPSFRGSSQSAKAHPVAIRRTIDQFKALVATSSPKEANSRQARVACLHAIQKISIDGCPNDFAEAWMRYLAVVQESCTVMNSMPETPEEHLLYGFVHGLNGELDGGTVNALREIKAAGIKMDNALNEVAIVAARYGVH